MLLDDGKVLASGPLEQTLARLDLPTAQEDEAGVVIEGRVQGFDARYQLLALTLPGSSLGVRVAHSPVAEGRTLRFRVLARDVSLSLEKQRDSSILNLLPARVVEEMPAANPAHVLVRLDVDGTPLLARITRFSRDQLGLYPGQSIWAQIKSVALLA
ncbi:molybdate transporter ATP-binding protein [compost metagenome]